MIKVFKSRLGVSGWMFKAGCPIIRCSRLDDQGCTFKVWPMGITDLKILVSCFMLGAKTVRKVYMLILLEINYLSQRKPLRTGEWAGFEQRQSQEQ